MNKYIKINDKDNVCVALDDIKAGDILDNIEINEDIPKGHKFSNSNIKKGDDIFKYGMPIGVAIKDIEIGSWVHTHNIKTKLNENQSYKYNKTSIDKEEYRDIKTFKGYRRDNGKVGIRNDIFILPTVGCINKICKNLEKLASKEYPDNEFLAIEHKYGCSQLGDDLEYTQKILAGIAKNPNASGVLVLSLGCENNQIEEFKKYLEPINKDRIKFLQVQDVSDEIEEAMKLIDELVVYSEKFKREEIDISELTIGFKCGGSDGFSGISANPLCGYTSDYLVDNKATTILTEVPEMFGAETLLMNRAKDEKVFNQIVKLINDFKDYFRSHGQTVYENPSPGNKKGGITTLEDKSLGCIQKGGNREVEGVLNFGEYPEDKGFHILNGPGNDLVSSTNLVASGCNIIVFTTGRGNPFGTVVPTIKMSTNKALYDKKRNWIDFDASPVLRGMKFEDLRDQFIDYLIEVASGNKVKNEINGFREISIFKDGVIL